MSTAEIIISDKSIRNKTVSILFSNKILEQTKGASLKFSTTGTKTRKCEIANKLQLKISLNLNIIGGVSDKQ